jgi:hypothetical protein
MFIYWISNNGQLSSIENIEAMITTELNTSATIAETNDLKMVTTPPITKRYGFTREGCTAYFQTDDVKSLTGGYDSVRRMCQEINPSTGIWIKLDRQITESEFMKYQDIEIYGPIKYETEEQTNVVRYNNKTVLGICLIVSVLITIVVYQQYKHEPIFSLIVLIILSTLSIIFTNQML